jgi:aldehyde:ferredoxin oxidoreductase
MGSNCMIDDLAAITKANYICNEMGYGHHQHGRHHRLRHGTGGTRLPVRSTEVGRSLEWGDADALVELTRMTGTA